LIDVGINTAPLAAARTGVGRYIEGLLGALAEVPDVRARRLFAPGPAARGLRPLLKLLPGAYWLAERRREKLLARETGLSLYHETNHAAPRFDGPLVLTIHDLSTVLHPHTQERARARHFAKSLKTNARNAQRVIVPTQAIAREVIEQLDVSSGRVRVIHHGVDQRFTPQPSKQRGNFVLYAGDDGPRKGFQTLRAAMPPNLELRCVGPGHGFVSDDELLELYRTCAIFVLPSLYEGFGLPLLEAMACGAPCIASDDPALVEVAGGAALHFQRGDRSALNQILMNFTGEQRLDLSIKGIARSQIFTWAECAQKHAQVYREAAA
jgi:glycosyltransferase involved in cell wall biosynthesis